MYSGKDDIARQLKHNKKHQRMFQNTWNLKKVIEIKIGISAPNKWFNCILLTHTYISIDTNSHTYVYFQTNTYKQLHSVFGFY